MLQMVFMIPEKRPVCVLDTNVLYPLISRDILFWSAWTGLFIPKWTPHIFKEWEGVMQRKGVANDQIKKRLAMAERAFPDATLSGYEAFIPTLHLPDTKDNHVLAGAIHCKADFILTLNLKDFPENRVSVWKMVVQTPDQFLSTQLVGKAGQADLILKKMIGSRKNPPLDERDMCHILANRGFTETSRLLSGLKR